ncbi:MAG: RsmE family RNA methyltransferase [Thermoanaerobaculia bacterium]
MNLLLLDPGEIRNGVVTLGGRRAEHLCKVLKVETGRRVRIGVIDGGTGFGEVLAVSAGGEVELAVDVADAPAAAGDVSSIDLIVALPRPQALHRILQSAAAMSVRRLDLVNGWRVEKSFFSSPSLRPETVRRHLLLGAEQGMTTRLPEVAIERLLVPFVTRLAERDSPPLRLIAHPDAAAPIESCFLLPASQRQRLPVEIAIGPEGGWIDRELETFHNAGFQPVRLGPWILRVETAVAAALAQIELLRRIAQIDGDHRVPPAGSHDNLVHRSAMRKPEES